MKKLIILLFVANINNASSCLRVDLIGRPPEVVLQTSLNHAKTMLPGQVCGAIWIDRSELCSAVAIDPYTVLTAAHPRNILVTDPKKIIFRLANNAHGGLESDELEINVKSIHVHESFIRLSVPDTEIVKDRERGYAVRHTNDFYFNDFQNLTFDRFKELGLPIEFEGSDILVLKLSEPLPGDLPYPTFMESTQTIKNMHGITIGCGEMKFNDQENGPRTISKNTLEVFRKHVYSSRVSESTIKETKIFVGEYEAEMRNGDESFIPNKEMMKTEGLPVVGDSGGPFFIKNPATDKYELLGLCSGTVAPLGSKIDIEYYREQFKGIVQPVFPIWQDLRPLKEWIQSLMGPSN